MDYVRISHPYYLKQKASNMIIRKTKNIARLLGILCLFLAGCHDQEREQRLQQREKAVLEKEKQFALKEADYQALTNLRDSLIALRDTGTLIAAWPDSIIGQWGSRVVCTASNCPDYVIGDQRSDIWEFSSDSTQMLTKVISNKALVRVYTGKFANREISLSYKTDSSATKQVDMNVVLMDISPTKMKGMRTVSVDNKCNAQFTVELSRIANP